ncbi:response regulator transcription factor [Sutcliffiella rhizosphaerae]|uniref:Alkaline phosphatase synthesis transcriptional regulatory protein PhoP n=1 Tax=Sutcliffiella rhizosphaerae TaxID=2880967 RepID=A0ABM8YRR5_9BACI|nr:response regulator [Sutcliffiella rhizosphaerae]CAG9622508.1 Alkaline phosphatase synthesis transcriptional regulatory protein PhoP [Sutcliffiella rhizosphaerae]
MAKILLADDESVLRMLITDTLEDEGHTVVEACSGKEAINVLKTEEHYDLVILDYMMPVFTGMEVFTQMKQMDLSPFPPVLILTAKTQKSVREEVENSGANFMSKPFSPLELAERVEALT